MQHPGPRAYLCASVGALAVYPFAPSLQTAIYTGIGATTLCLLALAAAVYRPPNARGWWTLAASVGVFAAGDLVYDLAPRFPGPADVLYLVGYPVWMAAIVVLVRHERLPSDHGAWIDAGIATGSVSAAVWCLFLDGRMPDASGLSDLVSWSYIASDLILLALAMRGAFLPGRRSRSFWWLVASVAVMPAADAAYVVPALQSTRYEAWINVLWLASYVAIAVAALDPSMRSMTAEGGRDDEAVVTMRRLYLIGASVMTVPLAAIGSTIWHGYVDVPVVAAAGMLVVAAITWRLVLITRDLHAARTEALLSERRFRMVFERAPVGISVGRDGMMTETNPALRRLLGYTEAELARMHYSEITHPDDVDLDVAAAVGRPPGESFSVEKRYVSRSGEVHVARVHIALGLDDGLGIGLIEDVTEQRALEERLSEAQKLEAVGKLAGGIAHDFNNLMTGVLGYSDLLLKRHGAGDVDREKLEAIRDAALRASDLTRQLLAFSRRQVLQLTDVDLRATVEHMDALLRRVVGPSVDVETALPPGEVVVRADRTQLEQVVLNLAVNARDAMPGGGTLRVGVAAEADSAVLTFADTGTGMDEHTVAHIFEPFFTTKPTGEGSGLGLATVHGIVGQSGGTIDVLTAPGAGTVFTVRLPLVVGRSVLPGAAPVASLVD